MNELIVKVENVNGKLVVSSRVVAGQLGKAHDKVIRDIRDKSLAKYGEWIIPNKYKANNGQEYNEYLLTKDGFIMLVFNYTGYNDFKEAYINKFNEMEKELQAISEKDRLYLGLFNKDPLVVANSHKALVELEVKPFKEKIEQDKPLVAFANKVSDSSDLILVREFCKLLHDKEIEIGEKRLYSWFRCKGYICKNSTEPTQRAMELGLFKVIERTVNTPYGEMLTQTTKITGKGQIYFVEMLKKNK